ncbi:HD domain-containing protein [Flavobacterium limnophilum]|uniref:HD domain-containing protein n=1 Tax=Flavobacterium limnophilum TaxID=3003262 RepID=UPI00248252D8|nr:ATP-binding protein [Flavobacterium limnophilum]
MIKYLEELLYEKTKETQSAILYAQWNYDKKVIPSALNAVSNIFPHYSLHDESHSITIINNIVRVLGKENMVKLSAIDIWLILEASYNHDIGMVVSSEELLKTIESDKFISFFKELLQDTKNSLYEFANQFNIIENKIRSKEDVYNLELNDSIKFILAEFFRRTHAERSVDIIINPLGELSIASPRGVIPARINRILANICSCHTKNFEDVMKLPFSEVGIDIEDAHPRFIACLLRIGDLLDLDNNRFSDVMLRTLTKVPIDTLNHKSKHLSIESFRVDKEIIEITANCKDYDVANITQHWFNYLNSEITEQMIRWNKIVPFKELGYLPSIGKLEVILENYDLIDGKNKPKFSVDTDKALALLQGAGIYDGAYQCIREVLQNAVDASLIRIWLEHFESSDFSTPQSKDFISLINDYQIIININEKEIEGDFKCWEIEINDKGTGISSTDLKFLMNTGSSSKNSERINIIENMPAWLKPSGTFGIGFQSIFMLTDLVTIETKSFFDEEFRIIELNSPSSKKNGDILIQKKKTTHAVKPGSKISFIHKTKAIPDGYIVNFGTNAERVVTNFDPFSNESMDVEIAKIVDEIFDFADKSYIPIKLFIDNEEIKISSLENKFDYFDPENSLEIKIHCGNEKNGWNLLTYYKNQNTENRLRQEFDALGFEINIHKDKASEVLTLNRNKIKSEYSKTLSSDFYKSSFKIISKNFDDIFQTEEEKSIGSMFLNFYKELNEIKDIDISQFNHWENFEVDLKIKGIDAKKKMIDLLRESKKIFIKNNPKRTLTNDDEYDFIDSELSISLSNLRPSFAFTKFFLLKIGEYFKAVESKIDAPNQSRTIIYSKEKQGSPIQDEELLIILKNTTQHSARVTIPCLEKYFDLRINDDSHTPYLSHYTLDGNIYFPFPKMLSPFIKQTNEADQSILKEEINDKLIDWVYDNRFITETTRQQIIEAYKLFCNDNDISLINSEETK